MPFTNVKSEQLHDQIKEVKNKLRSLNTLEEIEYCLRWNDDIIEMLYKEIRNDDEMLNQYCEFDITTFVDKNKSERELPLALLINEDLKTVKLLKKVCVTVDWKQLIDNNTVVAYVAMMIHYGYSIK